MDLLSGDGAMLDATGDDEEFALREGYGAVAKLHLEGALKDQEHLIFGVVLVPDEFTLELDELDVLAVQFADDPGSPVVEEEAQFFSQVYLVHGAIVAPGTPKQPERIAAEECADVRGDGRRDRRFAGGDGVDAGEGCSETRCRVKTARYRVRTAAGERDQFAESKDCLEGRSPSPVSSTTHKLRRFVLVYAPRTVPLQIVNFGSLLFIEQGGIVRWSR